MAPYRRLLHGLLFFALLAHLVGCGATQFSAGNRRLLEALQTAISSENMDWLEAVAKQVADKQAQGQISPAEVKALDAIIAQARRGDWNGAKKAVFALSDGMRPTDEDLARLKERKSAKD